MDIAGVAIVGSVVVAVIAVLFIFALVSIGRSPASGTEKAVWILVALLFPVLGSILWFAFGPNYARRSNPS